MGSCMPCIQAKFPRVGFGAMHCFTYLKHCVNTLTCPYVEIKPDLEGTVAVFDGKGKTFAPCELDSELQEKHAPKAKDQPLCRAPHFLIDVEWEKSLAMCMGKSQCEPKEEIGKLIAEDSCALCNSQHCKCASTNNDAHKSIMKNM